MSLPDCGHGWVHKNPDGVVARCGGPGICTQCSMDQFAVDLASCRFTLHECQAITIDGGEEAAIGRIFKRLTQLAGAQYPAPVNGQVVGRG
jgi:hypothetical protein